MPTYKIDYKVTAFYFCSTEIEADSEEEAIALLESDYSNYEDDADMYDSEFEIKHVRVME